MTNPMTDPISAELIRAHEINGAMCDCHFSTMGLGNAAPEWLANISLVDLIQAARLVEEDNKARPFVDGKKTFTTVPDDRLIAAIFTILHYHPGDIIVGDGRGKSLVVRSFRAHGAV